MFSWTGISFIASAAGAPKKLHPETEACKDFDAAKVYVVADLTKDLPTEVRFKSKSGIDSKVTYGYPWLPPRCTSCIKWGHLAATCRSNKSSSTSPRIILKREDRNQTKGVPVAVETEPTRTEPLDCREISENNSNPKTSFDVGSTSSGNQMVTSDSGVSKTLPPLETVVQETTAAWTTILSPPRAPFVAHREIGATINISQSRFAILSETLDLPIDSVEQVPGQSAGREDQNHETEQAEMVPIHSSKPPSTLPPRTTRGRKGLSNLEVHPDSSTAAAASNKKKNKKKH